MDYTHQRRWIASEFFWKVLLCSCKPSRNIRASLWYICQPKLIPTLFWAQWPIKAPCLFIRIQCVKTKKKTKSKKRLCTTVFLSLVWTQSKLFCLVTELSTTTGILPAFFMQTILLTVVLISVLLESCQGYSSFSTSLRVGTPCELYINTDANKTVRVKIWWSSVFSLFVASIPSESSNTTVNSCPLEF